ncbi:MAG TPA: SET domain-containing protein-lysine N-methyltransferase [Acidimicrobiales bacterium]|nr:SET domain-containing protein-lysine N-methyltransferase [Acidimicrobiales bacterium]
MLATYLTPKAAVRPAGDKGLGVFATAPIREGETVAAFGGYVVDRATLDSMTPERQSHSIQIDTDLFMASSPEPEPSDFVNHSCDPNTGIDGNILLVARRDITPGEELTFDYAMSDVDDYDEFECACGTARCRRKVTGNDWMIPELQERYRGHFSAYVARRIAALQAQTPADSLL